MTDTDTRPTLIPVRQIKPKPQFSWRQHDSERHDANYVEARQLVTTHAGALPVAAGTELVAAIASALDWAERRGTDGLRNVPELIPVYDYRPGDTPPPEPADGGVVDLADYDTPTHGLQCPHCGEITWDGDGCGIYVVDRGERWSRFGYELSTVDELEQLPRPEGGTVSKRTGRQVEQRAVLGSYGGSPDMDGAGYRCESCARPVALPDGVTEDGS